MDVQSDQFVFFESNPLPSWICEEKTFQVLYVNQAAVSLLGYSHSWWVKRSLCQDEAEKLSGNSPVVADLGTKEGGTVQALLYWNSIPWGKQNVLHVVASVKDRPAAKNHERDSVSLLKDFRHAIVSATIVSMADKQGTITYVNENFEKISGYTSAELIGENHRIVNSGYHSHDFWVEMWRTIAHGQTWRADVKNKTKNGTYYWVDTFIMPFLDAEGNVREYLSIRNDITRRKENEEELKRSKENLSEVMRFACMGTTELNLESGIITLGEELLELLEEDKQGKYTLLFSDFVRTYIYAEDHDYVLAKLKEGAETGDEKKILADFRMVTAKGNIRSIEAQGTFLRHGNVIGLLQDVTDQHRAEKETLAKSRQIERILLSITDGFFAVDRQFNFTMVNPVFSTLAGYAEKDMIGKNLLTLFPFMKGSSLMEEYRTALETGETRVIEHQSTQDPNRYYEVNVYPSPEGLFIYYKDISSIKTARKAKEEIWLIYRHLFDYNPLPMWIFDRQTLRFLSVNDTAVYKYGYTKEEFLEMTINDIRPVAELSKLAEFRQVPHGDYFHSEGWQHKLKNGTIIHVEIHAHKINYQGKRAWFVVANDITERKRAEAEIRTAVSEMQKSQRQLQTTMDNLRESEQRFRILADSAPAMIWMSDPNGANVYFNRGWLDFTGKALEDSVQGGWTDCIFQEDLATSVEIYRDAFSKQESFTIECRLRKHSGEYRWIVCNGSPRYLPNGEFAGYISTCMDIHERKLAEHSLAESEARYRSIVDDQQELICRYDREGQLTFVNKAFAKVFGGTQQSLIGLSIFQFIVGKDHETVRRLIGGMFEGTLISEPLQQRVIVDDGSSRWQEWYNVPLKNQKGEVYEIQALGHDITHRKRLEAEQARLDLIVRESYNEIFLFHWDSLVFEFANASALNNLGYKREELIRMRFSDLFNYPDEMALLALLNPLRRGDTDRLQLQMKYNRKDGSYYDVEAVIQILEKDRSFVVIATDITEKLIIERKLMASVLEKETLIKEIHHRVKNNLQLISSIIYIKMNSLEEPEIRHFLESTRQKIRSIALIHERLLQSEKLDKVELSDYLGKLIYDLQVTHYRQDLQLEIKTEVEKTIMDLDTAIYCGLIVNELITNAIKHAFKGRSTGVIEVTFQRVQNKNVLAVMDDGVTIPADVIPGRSGSFGMQLLEIFVRQLGGTIEVIREKGTKFQMRF